MWIKSSEPILSIDGSACDQGTIDLSRIDSIQKAPYMPNRSGISYGIIFHRTGGAMHDWGYTSEEVRDRDYDAIMRMLEPTDLSNHNPHALSENPYALAKDAHNKLITKDSISYGDFEMGFVLGYTAKS